MPMTTGTNELTINWDRAILIDRPIDDDLVKSLAPRILSLRQSSNDPITVGIDCPGGSLSSLDVLLGLLSGPNQDGKTCTVVTVATHRAYSAAATLLAFGNYSVALKHSQILYHDVRWSGIDDVTPEKARDAAKSLQDANDAFSLRLARRIISRLVWIYIDARKSFPDIQSKYSQTFKLYKSTVELYAPPVTEYDGLDLAAFATYLWAKLSRQNDKLIERVMRRLGVWIHLMGFVKLAPTYRVKGTRSPGLLDGARHMHKLLGGSPSRLDACSDSFKLLLSLIVSELSETKSERFVFSQVVERATREFNILESMNDPKHVRHASGLLLRHSTIFFGVEVADELETMNEEEKAKHMAKASPHANLLWHFCVLLCRELFEGEHVLGPNDAQLLGLVDEVAGGGPIQSRREFRISTGKQ
jgi:ATP-dependent protease ClpP protease subunit